MTKSFSISVILLKLELLLKNEALCISKRICCQQPSYDQGWTLRNGVLFALPWLAWVACLRGWCASVGDVGGVLAWVACQRGWRGWRGWHVCVDGVLAWVACLRGWRASVGGLGRVLAWVTC